MSYIQAGAHWSQTSKPNESAQLFPQQNEPLQRISLRELKLRNFQTENAIKAVQARISYMKIKQQKTLKKVLIVKRKLTSLQNVKSKAKEQKEIIQEEKKKQEELQAKKSQLNKLIKDHLKYNKQIVVTLMNHKIGQESKSFKEKLTQYSMLNHVQRQNARQENAEKANRVRVEHIQAQQKRKNYFLDKLKQFKQNKQQKLRQELKERERQQLMISELQQKERLLLERLSVSQKFRLKCQREFQQAKSKYHSFYQTSRGLSKAMGRKTSLEADEEDENERKADIFIS